MPNQPITHALPALFLAVGFVLLLLMLCLLLVVAAVGAVVK